MPKVEVSKTPGRTKNSTKTTSSQAMVVTPEIMEALVQHLQPTPKHFTHRPVRCDGTSNSQVVHTSLNSADFFKTSEGITDDNAIGLSLLLIGPGG